MTVVPAPKYPWDWTSHDVVEYLARRAHLEIYFKSEPLRATFIENEINGLVLLDESFTEQTLRNDLGIKQVGIRIGIWRVINDLRQTYHRRPSIDLVDNLLLPPPGSPRDDSPEILQVPETTVINFGPLNAQLVVPEVHRSAALFSTPGPSRLITRTPHSIFKEKEDVPIEAEHSIQSFDLPTPESPTPFHEGQEHFDSDEELPLSQALSNVNIHNGDDVSTLGSTEMELSFSESVRVDGLDELFNDFIATNNADEVDMAEATQLPESVPITPQPSPKHVPRELQIKRVPKRPLAKSSSPVEGHSVIRRRTSRAKPYLSRGSLTAQDVTIVADLSDSDDFVIRGGKSPAGITRSVNGLMKARLRTKVVDKKIDGKRHIAHANITVRHIQKHQRNPITVINEDEGVRLGQDIKRYIHEFPELDVMGQVYRQKKDRAVFLDLVSEKNDMRLIDPYKKSIGDGYYDDLKEKYIAIQSRDPTHVRIQYDNGDESPGLDSDTLLEIEHDMNPKPPPPTPNRKQLAIEQIQKVWEDAKKAVIQKWREDRLPALERMKYGIWKRARKGEYDESNRNVREELGKNILKKLELKDRLEAQLVEFCDGKWYSASKLQRQMKSNSGQSIRDLEEYLWRISILPGKRPPKPPPRQRSRMSQVIPASQPFELEGDNMDEEDLGDEDSGMEESDELDEGLDGFIVDDDVYDSGHENLRAENEALLAEHKNRFQKVAADVVMDEADSQIEETVPGPDIVLSDARRPTPADTEDAMVTGVSEGEDVPTEARPMNIDKGKGVAKKNSDSLKWFDNFSDYPPPAPVLEDTTAISLLGDVDFVPPSVSGPFTITYNETPGESSNRPVSTSPVKIKTERASPSASLIAVTSAGVIDLTMDTPPASPGLPAASTSKSASGYRNPGLLKLIESDLESDLQIQKAIENSLKERDTNSTPRALPQRSTPSSSSVPTRPKEPINICQGGSESPSWMSALQGFYTKKPWIMAYMRDVARRVTNKRTPESLETRLVMFLVTGKDAEIASLGLTPREDLAHRYLARVYFKWSYPNKKAGKLDKDMRAKLSVETNVNRFLRELTPILDRIVEYEGAMPSEPAIERQSPVPDFMILGHENTEDGSTNKEKGKERASLLSLSPPPESDTEQSARDFSQSSARHSSPPDSQSSKPRHVVKHREVKESAATVAHRETQKKEMKNTRKRELQQEKSGKKGEIINLGHYAPHDPVYFPSFSKLEQLYEFQKEGIQFLWKSLILAKARRGALLAHTMGMGKTRQVATFLGAYAETAQSENPRMYGQIPDELKHVRVVVVAPAGLLDNWDEEITKWRIDHLQRVYVISSKSNGREQSSDMIKKWANDGTTLLIGYETLRSLIKKSPEYSPVSASKKPKATNEPKQNMCDEELAHNNHIADLLLNTPSIVVADEAHRIKNSDSDLAKIFSKFKTKTRIAMTGSPLSNNLTDYYNLIYWIDKDYAGKETDFNSKFKLPIQDGLFHDSTPTQVSNSRVLQKHLITTWGQKMHRVSLANIQGIRNMLPDKTEFMITLPLTTLQYQIYDLYTSKVRTKMSSEVSNFFKFIQDLSILLSHPEILWKSLQEKFNNSNTRKTITPAKKESSRVSIASPDPTSADDAASNGEDLVAETTEENTLGEVEGSVFAKVKAVVERRGLDLSLLDHSYRIVALLKILNSCIEIKEKVLVFSQSVKTLNYIAEILKRRRIAYNMLHGDVKSGKRQDITREFSSSDTYVFLISTKAGGLGLNIQSASRIIMFDCLFSPQDEEQAVGRAYRLGQKKHVFVYRFRIGGTYEDIKHNNSLLKMSLAMRMVDKKEPIREASKTKVHDWFKPPHILEDVDMDLESFRGKDPKVLDGLLGEMWIKGLNTQNTYDMQQDEPLTEKEEQEYKKLVEEEEAKRNSVTSPTGPTETSKTAHSSTPKRVPSTVDAAGEPSRPPLTTPKPRKKRDSATGPPATPVTPSIARSQASPSNSGSPVLVLR
ncbi:hypothetical protein H072_11233 [Dactylellina haptotyla CBS 200.50]|uniref:Uncharacterized protein n=1 Tax=Dactylellina haptotyla (strain CBS 200.50) TaxID=1284197 RepID=S7ZYA0_DACHA|nr:hypothetical protein H072_11233 [Dactylellina haptotyla CBS 200.50]